MTHSREDLEKLAHDAFLRALNRFNEDQAEREALLQKNGVLSGPGSHGLKRAPNGRFMFPGLKIDMEPPDNDPNKTDCDVS